MHYSKENPRSQVGNENPNHKVPWCDSNPGPRGERQGKTPLHQQTDCPDWLLNNFQCGFHLYT